ncbi:MAG: ClpXP protease specificity-enhancing factor [Gammaproteobacteria bacterium]|nr:ClpXP protease specificity-enhancing factor [Gammaproteobacteria bacterium]MDH5591252.1 ClpXP protease specificity-enhancing factor [Gammaproteobacteria bacterium]
MTSQKPYLIRAVYEWLLDNQGTPYLLVNATLDGVQVPHEYVNDGKIVLNIDPGAVNNFHADNEWISFSARFSGKPMELFIPIAAIEAIYGKENNQGMFFSVEEPSPPPPKQTSTSNKPRRPGLTVVK